jgi:hypothetical protein
LSAIRRQRGRQRLDVGCLLHRIDLVQRNLVHWHRRRHRARPQASRMHWTGWQQAWRVHWARRLNWAGLLHWHRLLHLAWVLHWDRLRAGRMWLVIRLELEVEAALASVLPGISLPRGRWLLDLNVSDVHVWLMGILCPVVGVLAHRVSRRRIIKSDWCFLAATD